MTVSIILHPLPHGRERSQLVFSELNPFLVVFNNKTTTLTHPPLPS